MPNQLNKGKKEKTYIGYHVELSDGKNKVEWWGRAKSTADSYTKALVIYQDSTKDIPYMFSRKVRIVEIPSERGYGPSYRIISI